MQRRLSDGEWTVMNAVWRGAPATAREVLERIAADTGWAYTTVKTMLDRLVAKGALTAEKAGNTRRYAPRITRPEARRSALRALLDRAFDGTFGGLVHHLMAEETLSARDREELARMLAEPQGDGRDRDDEGGDPAP
ncbi:MAG: BlaI/MecI/CopY family transcriptional regulator [Planctomycetota bacterium]